MSVTPMRDRDEDKERNRDRGKVRCQLPSPSFLNYTPTMQIHGGKRN